MSKDKLITWTLTQRQLEIIYNNLPFEALNSPHFEPDDEELIQEPFWTQEEVEELGDIIEELLPSPR